MKKNVLFIVLDSITNSQLFNNSCSTLKAPFLCGLRESSISGDKMFSLAPYTEAALMALLGSMDTLDDNGYMEKFKNKKTVIDYFNDNGYKTFFANYYPSIYPSYMYYGASEVRYIENYHISHLWDYRLSYFKDVYLRNDLSIKEEEMLIQMLDDNLKEWLKILNLLKNNDEQTIMINDCVSKELVDEEIGNLENEINKFLQNKREYLYNFFQEGSEHILFKINKTDYIDKVKNDEFRKWFKLEYTSVFEKIKNLQTKRNFKNGRFPFKKMGSNLKNKDVVKGLLAGYKNLLFDKDIMNRIDVNYDLFKAQRSFRTVANVATSWIDNNKDDSKPWMCYIHVDDAHYPENFFTYDTTDKETINNEFKRINNFLDHLPKDYCGTIASDLSLLYCDMIIENIFKYLEDNNLMKNTSVVITADHGFSYYFNPIREKYVTTSYRENYNVPFIIYDKELIPRKIDGFLSTKDIPATLLDLAGIAIPESFKGNSLLQFHGRDFAMLEYMGGGCPDIKRRPVLLGVRNDNVDVIALFDRQNVLIKEIYDIKNDPLEHNNIAKNYNGNIDREISIMEKRYKEIVETSGDIS